MEIAAAIAPLVLQPGIERLLKRFGEELKNIGSFEEDVHSLLRKVPLLKDLATQLLDLHCRSLSLSDTLSEPLKQGLERWIDEIEDAENTLAKCSSDTTTSFGACCISPSRNIKSIKQIKRKMNEMQGEVLLYVASYFIRQIHSPRPILPSREIMGSSTTLQVTELQRTDYNVTIESRLNGQILHGDIDIYDTDFVVVPDARNPPILVTVTGEEAMAIANPSSIVLLAHAMDNGQHMSIQSCQEQLLVTTDVKRILEINDLSLPERWKLFRFHVFKNTYNEELYGNEMEEILVAIFHSIASKPYLVEAVARILARVDSPFYWHLKLAQFTLPPIHLYDRYKALPNFIRSCFLSCAVFPKTEEIEVENLVQLWIAEGLLPIKHPHIDLVNFGYEVVKLLLRYRFIDVSDYDWEGRPVRCTMPDRVHYMAVQILNQREIFFLRPRENLDSFTWPKNSSCSTISLIGNNIQHLPKSLRRSSVRSLLLGDNRALKRIPHRFLEGLIWLRVLDLSNTAIVTLPSSLGRLKRLVHLNLSCTEITKLHKSITSLRQLQFLILSSCRRLEFLPTGICQLQSLKHLDVGGCNSLRSLPCGIHKLEALQVLKTNATRVWSSRSGYFSGMFKRIACLDDLKALRNINCLYLEVESEDEFVISDGVLGNKTKMRSLWLRMNKLEILPEDMQAITDLTQLQLFKCKKLQELPAWVSEFCNLRFLCLNGCYSLRSLPCLETMPLLRALLIEFCDALMELPSQFGLDGAFPALQSLALVGLKIRLLPRLERGAMPKLRHLALRDCKNLSTLPDGIECLEYLQTLELVGSDLLVPSASNHSTLRSSIQIRAQN